MKDTLSNLFGSPLRLKLVRLFVFNQHDQFDAATLAKKFNAKPKEAEKEAVALAKAGIAKTGRAVVMVEKKKGKKVVQKKIRVPAWSLEPKLKFAEPLAEFLMRAQSLEHKAIVGRLEKAGRLKAVVVSGIFMRDAESRLDLFIVGEGMKTDAIDRIVKGIEADLGRDIRYVALSAADYAYRVSMNDKLVRDVFDYPHTVLVDKIGFANA
jgi:hypothetical protein